MAEPVPLLLLPGMMCTGRLFGPQLAELQAHRPVRVADLTQGDSMEMLARLVLAAAPWPRFALAGLSMGGILAMEIIRQAPDRIAGLGLIDTNPWAEPEETREKREPQMQAVRDGQLLTVMGEQMAPKYSPDDYLDTGLLELVLSMAAKLGPDVFLRQSIALRDRPDQTETLKRVRVPTLVLCGEQDQLCPVDRHLAIADLVPDCDLKILPGVGHLPTLQAPDDTNIALSRWLERLK